MSNQPDRQEQLFAALASRYAEEYGRELLQELDALNQSNTRQTSPQLALRVQRAIRARKRQSILRYGGVAAAACILLTILATGVLELPFVQTTPPAPAPAESAPADPTPAEPAPPEQTYAVIPMGFSPGEQFAVTGFEQDISRSIYYLENTYRDDVVLTLEYLEHAGAQDYTGLDRIPIGSETVYGTYRAAYSMITFEKEDVVYTMTCKYDINTLIELSEVILL